MKRLNTPTLNSVYQLSEAMSCKQQVRLRLHIPAQLIGAPVTATVTLYRHSDPVSRDGSLSIRANINLENTLQKSFRLSTLFNLNLLGKQQNI
jgi:hypothetical protein